MQNHIPIQNEKFWPTPCSEAFSHFDAYGFVQMEIPCENSNLSKWVHSPHHHQKKPLKESIITFNLRMTILEFRKMLMITLYAEQKKKDTDL